jgi:hypothetical protein
VLYGLLTVLASNHQLDLLLAHGARFFLQPLAKAFDLIFSQRDPDFGDLVDGSEPAQRVDEDRRSGKLGELLRKMRLTVFRARHWGHACPKTGSGNNDNNLHGGL